MVNLLGIAKAAVPATETMQQWLVLFGCIREQCDAIVENSAGTKAMKVVDFRSSICSTNLDNL